jgi:hypothetical protein
MVNSGQHSISVSVDDTNVIVLVITKKCEDQFDFHHPCPFSNDAGISDSYRTYKSSSCSLCTILRVRCNADVKLSPMAVELLSLPTSAGHSIDCHQKLCEINRAHNLGQLESARVKASRSTCLAINCGCRSITISIASTSISLMRSPSPT